MPRISSPFRVATQGNGFWFVSAGLNASTSDVHTRPQRSIREQLDRPDHHRVVTESAVDVSRRHESAGNARYLAAESCPAADSESSLQCAILLAVLPCRPHERAEDNCSHNRNTDHDDDHGCDRHKDRTSPLGRDVYRIEDVRRRHLNAARPRGGTGLGEEANTGLAHHRFTLGCIATWLSTLVGE